MALKGFQAIIPFEIKWLQFTETLIIKMGILLDPISVMMLVVVTTISFMVHIYSLGYMKGETGFCALLRILIAVYFCDARTGYCNQYFPDVHFLGIGWC